MNAIVAVDENWGIGCAGKLLVHIPKDLKYFKEKTVGKVVVVGRKTLQSFPKGKPLPNRTNIVLSRDKKHFIEGVLVCHSLEELEQSLEQYTSEDVYIIGGEEIYKALINKCEKAYVTKIQAEFGADTFFVDLDTLENWVLQEESDIQEENGILFRFCCYKNINIK